MRRHILAREVLAVCAQAIQRGPSDEHKLVIRAHGQALWPE
jgi:hypothetical protein